MKNCLSRAGKRALLGLAVGCGILLAGCHKEPGPGNPKDGTVTVRLSPGAAREIVVKSIGENNFDPNGIASVYAIQLDGGGNVLTDKDDSNKKLIDWYSSDQLTDAGNEQKRSGSKSIREPKRSILSPMLMDSTMSKTKRPSKL